MSENVRDTPQPAYKLVEITRKGDIHETMFCGFRGETYADAAMRDAVESKHTLKAMLFYIGYSSTSLRREWSADAG